MKHNGPSSEAQRVAEENLRNEVRYLNWRHKRERLELDNRPADGHSDLAADPMDQNTPAFLRRQGD